MFYLSVKFSRRGGQVFGFTKTKTFRCQVLVSGQVGGQVFGFSCLVLVFSFQPVRQVGGQVSKSQVCLHSSQQW